MFVEAFRIEVIHPMLSAPPKSRDIGIGRSGLLLVAATERTPINLTVRKNDVSNESRFTALQQMMKQAWPIARAVVPAS